MGKTTRKTVSIDTIFIVKQNTEAFLKFNILAFMYFVEFDERY